MTNIDVTIEFTDPGFITAIEDPSGFMPYLGKAMEEIMTVYQEVAEVYAPESEANKPGRYDKDGHPMGYYERGRGWWRPVSTHNKLSMGQEIPTIKPHSKSPKTLGAIALLAVDITGVAGYKLNSTSQQMHDHWEHGVTQATNEVTGNLNNSVGYSGRVQGLEQTPIHASRGWQTVLNSWLNPAAQNVVEDVTLRAIASYYHLGA